jgi:hypothetical protein
MQKNIVRSYQRNNTSDPHTRKDPRTLSSTPPFLGELPHHVSLHPIDASHQTTHLNLKSWFRKIQQNSKKPIFFFRLMKKYFDLGKKGRTRKTVNILLPPFSNLLKEKSSHNNSMYESFHIYFLSVPNI